MTQETDGLHAIVQRDIADIKEDLHKIEHNFKMMSQTQGSVSELLARYDERMKNTDRALERAFTALTEQGARISKIELEQPVTTLVRGLALKMILAVACVAGIPTSVQVWLAVQRPQVAMDRTITESVRPQPRPSE